MANTRFQKTPLHYIQYLALKWFCVLFGLLPYKTAVWLGRKATGAVRFVMKKRFNRSVYDIRRAFPKMTEEEARATALESWRNMGGILAEFIKLTQMTPEEFKKHSRIIGAEKMLNAQNVTGGIIHIGHFTNWEAFGLAGAVYGVDKAVLAQRVDNPYVDEGTNRLRNIFTGRTFYSNNEDKPFFACMRWLKKKKMLGILIDQNAGSSEVWVPFMGRIAAFSPITALLAIKMQVPVFPVRVWREKDGTIVSEVMDAVYPPKEFSMENVRKFTKILVGYYEDWLKDNPGSWLWAHNRWKREAEGEAYLKAHPEERV